MGGCSKAKWHFASLGNVRIEAAVKGYVSVGVCLGSWALAKLRSDRTEAKWWRIDSAVLGMLAISLLGRLPYVGMIVVFGGRLFGLGAMLLQVRTRSAAS